MVQGLPSRSLSLVTCEKWVKMRASAPAAAANAPAIRAVEWPRGSANAAVASSNVDSWTTAAKPRPSGSTPALSHVSPRKRRRRPGVGLDTQSLARTTHGAPSAPTPCTSSPDLSRPRSLPRTPNDAARRASRAPARSASVSTYPSDWTGCTSRPASTRTGHESPLSPKIFSYTPRASGRRILVGASQLRGAVSAAAVSAAADAAAPSQPLSAAVRGGQSSVTWQGNEAAQSHCITWHAGRRHPPLTLYLYARCASEHLRAPRMNPAKPRGPKISRNS